MKLTSEEILKLPKEDFINFMKSVEDEQIRKLEKIEFSNCCDYYSLSFEEKVNVWCEEINSVMHKQVEGGFDEYFLFKRNWYLKMKSLEPKFDLIIEKVFEKFEFYKWDWSKEEYLKRINLE